MRATTPPPTNLTPQPTNSRPQLEPRAVTMGEAARLLQVHVMTVKRAVYRGELPSFIIGKRARRISLDALRAFMAGRTPGEDGAA